MERFVYLNELYLLYKDLLNENYKDIFNLYYGENLSMQEIAEIKEISKSRVGIIIKNCEKKLISYEKILELYKKKEKLNNVLKLNDILLIKKEIENILKGE